MLARYRMNASCTVANFQSDMNAMILGTAATVNNLSSGCDKANSSFIGGYPTGTYARVDSPTAINITTAVCTSNTATLSFANQGSTPFAIGQLITVAGITGVTNYNGSFVVTGGSATTVTYALPTVSAGTTAGATVINSTTFTYSKIHNEYTDITHYLRLEFNSLGIKTITLARSYVSGTNTLVDSQTLVDEFLPDSGIFTGTITVTGRNSFLNVARTIGDRIDVLRTTPIAYIDSTNLRNPLQGTRLLTTTQVNRLQTVDSQELVAFQETDQLNIRFTTFNADYNAAGIDLVITNKCLYISSPQSESTRARSAHTGVDVGIFDIGKTGVSREFTNSMCMCNTALSSRVARIPHYYRLDTRSYGALIDNPIVGNRPRKMFRSDGTTVVVENPAFLQQTVNGDTVAAIYGLFFIPDFFILDNYIYEDAAELHRFVKFNYSILTE